MQFFIVKKIHCKKCNFLLFKISLYKNFIVKKYQIFVVKKNYCKKCNFLLLKNFIV